MVSWSTADLKFVNTTSLPIFITCEANGQNLIFNIYGNTKDNSITIKTVSEITNFIPSQGDKILADVEKKYFDKIKYKGEFLK
jgi:vancomycin resistance protein YoaR